MGSAERPPNALSLKSSETRLGRGKRAVQRERSDWGISEMRRPVKMSEKSAICGGRGGRSASSKEEQQSRRKAGKRSRGR